MYSLNDDGTIMFKKKYKMLYEVFYHITDNIYNTGPTNNRRLNSKYKSYTLKGIGFLVLNNGNDPSISLGLGYRHNISINLISTNNNTSINNNGNNNNNTSNNAVLSIYTYRKDYNRMIPVLDSNYNIASYNIRDGVTLNFTLLDIQYVCIYSSTNVEIKVNIESIPISEPYKRLDNLCLFKKYQNNSDNNISQSTIYSTVKIDGLHNGFLTVVNPEFYVMYYHVKESLRILSLDVPDTLVSTFDITSNSNISDEHVNVKNITGTIDSNRRQVNKVYTTTNTNKVCTLNNTLVNNSLIKVRIEMTYDNDQLWLDLPNEHTNWAIEIPYNKTIHIKTIMITCDTDDVKVGGIVTIQYTPSKWLYYYCVDTNGVKCAYKKDDIRECEVYDVNIKGYHNFTINVNGINSQNVDISNAACYLEYEIL